MPQFMITAIGPDRPGLVDEFTGFLLESGANVADSRMVNLGGRCALLLLADVPERAVAKVHRDAADVGKRIGLTVNAEALVANRVGADARSVLPYRLKVRAMDQPGIVHHVTHVLHGYEVNIEELETHLEPGSYTGTPLFAMDLRMTMPTSVQVNALRQDLEQVCDSLNCDVELHAG